MPDPAWPCSPPEANYLRLAGTGAAGTATTLASAAAWQALMVSGEMAFSVSTLNTAATALGFEGLGGASSAATAGGLNNALQLLAGWVQAKPPIAASAVSAYQTAVSAMIPAEVSMANRAEQAADVALNPLVLGALTPAIVALDLEYFGEHWPHNASAGAAYGSALTALLPALAVPPPLAPPGAAAMAPAVAASAVAESAAQTLTDEAMKQTSQAAGLADDSAAPVEQTGQAGRLISAAVQPLQSMVQPVTGMFTAPLQGFQSLAGLPQELLGQLTGEALAGDAASTTAMPVAPAAFGAGGAAAGGGLGLPGAGVGSPGGGGGAGAVPGAAVTSYTRPNSSFAPEGSGRPVGLKSGLLSASEMRGLTVTAPGAPIPVSPAQTGSPGRSKDETRREDLPHARIVITDDRESKNQDS